ncbi:hypothetical protein ROZALSC1DRAFT_24363, partial [Rozella allomycis CSF55]
MAPLKHPSLSLSSSKSKIKMNYPLNNDVFQSHPVLTNLEIFMDPLQNSFKSKETISNSSPSKQLSKMNLPVVDCSQSSFEANHDQSKNQSCHKYLNSPMDPFKHLSLSLSLSKSRIKMNLPLNNDACIENQPVPLNQHPSISAPKSKIDMDLPLENDVLFQNRPSLNPMSSNAMLNLNVKQFTCTHPEEKESNLVESGHLCRDKLGDRFTQIASCRINKLSNPKQQHKVSDDCSSEITIPKLEILNSNSKINFKENMINEINDERKRNYFISSTSRVEKDTCKGLKNSSPEESLMDEERIFSQAICNGVDVSIPNERIISNNYCSSSPNNSFSNHFSLKDVNISFAQPSSMFSESSNMVSNFKSQKTSSLNDSSLIVSPPNDSTPFQNETSNKIKCSQEGPSIAQDSQSISSSSVGLMANERKFSNSLPYPSKWIAPSLNQSTVSKHALRQSTINKSRGRELGQMKPRENIKESMKTKIRKSTSISKMTSHSMRTNCIKFFKYFEPRTESEGGEGGGKPSQAGRSGEGGKQKEVKMNQREYAENMDNRREIKGDEDGTAHIGVFNGKVEKVEEGEVMKQRGESERTHVDLDKLTLEDDEGGVDVLMGRKFDQSVEEGGVKEQADLVERIKSNLNNSDKRSLEDDEGEVDVLMEIEEEGELKKRGDVVERIEYELYKLHKGIVEDDEGGVEILMGPEFNQIETELEEGGVEEKGSVVERDLDIMKIGVDEGGVDIRMRLKIDHVEMEVEKGGVKEQGGVVEMKIDDDEGGIDVIDALMGPELDQFETKLNEEGEKEQGGVADIIKSNFNNLHKVIEDVEGGVDVVMGPEFNQIETKVEEGGVMESSGVAERDMDKMKFEDDEGGVDVLMGPEFDQIETEVEKGGVKEQGGVAERIKSNLNNSHKVIEDVEGGVDVVMNPEFDKIGIEIEEGGVMGK